MISYRSTISGVPLDLVGVREIAERLGVANVTVRKWKADGLMPAPEGTVSGFPAWRWATIRKWAERTNRPIVHDS